MNREVQKDDVSARNETGVECRDEVLGFRKRDGNMDLSSIKIVSLVVLRRRKDPTEKRALAQRRVRRIRATTRVTGLRIRVRAMLLPLGRSDAQGREVDGLLIDALAEVQADRRPGRQVASGARGEVSRDFDSGGQGAELGRGVVLVRGVEAK